MSKNKQIEEMASDVAHSISWFNGDLLTIDCRETALMLYEKGYRKQSEAIEEYRKKVYSKMEKYTVFGREYIQRIMREVEKEMKGGAE